MKWEFTDFPTGYVKISVALYFNETPSSGTPISDFSQGSTNVGLSGKGERLFSTRMSIALGEKNFSVIINDLRYNDSGQYWLFARVAKYLAARDTNVSESVITVAPIKGESGFAICNSCCLQHLINRKMLAGSK